MLDLTFEIYILRSITSKQNLDFEKMVGFKGIILISQDTRIFVHACFVAYLKFVIHYIQFHTEYAF